jgi:hypothetical protein
MAATKEAPATSKSVVIQNGALDEEDGDIILRGRLDPRYLGNLQVDTYQREILSESSLNEIIDGFKKGSVPDIDLGMRGQRVREEDGLFILLDPVYIVDGLQRVSAANLLLAQETDVVPRLGAEIHFGTTFDWERERFHILNAKRAKLSSNVLLRNMQHDAEVVEVILKLTEDKTFVMYGLVSWTQRQSKHELISAMTYAKTVAALHSHIGPGRSNRLEDLVLGLETISMRTGRQTLRDNIKRYYGVVDEAWGIKQVAFKEGAVYMRSTFQSVLARVLSQHVDFWDGNRLVVSKDVVQKLHTFPLRDPTVAGLASGSGKASSLLFSMLVEHLNSRKRTKRLEARDQGAIETETFEVQ